MAKSSSNRSTMSATNAEFLNRRESALVEGTIMVFPPQYVHKSKTPYNIDGREVYGNMLECVVVRAEKVGQADANPIHKSVSYQALRKMSFGKDITEVKAVATDKGVRGNRKANVSNIIGTIVPQWQSFPTSNPNEVEFALAKPFVVRVLAKRDYAFPILEETEQTDATTGKKIYDYKNNGIDLELDIVQLNELDTLDPNDPAFKSYLDLAISKLEADCKL